MVEYVKPQLNNSHIHYQSTPIIKVNLASTAVGGGHNIDSCGALLPVDKDKAFIDKASILYTLIT